MTSLSLTFFVLLWYIQGGISLCWFNLGFVDILGSADLVIFIKSESLRAIISSNVFSVPVFNLLFFCDYHFLCWYTWGCPWVLRLCSSFFNLFFCQVFMLGRFLRSVFMFIDSSAISHLLLRPSSGSSLVVQWLRPPLTLQGARVWFLAGELRSCILCSMAQKRKRIPPVVLLRPYLHPHFQLLKTMKKCYPIL